MQGPLVSWSRQYLVVVPTQVWVPEGHAQLAVQVEPVVQATCAGSAARAVSCVFKG